MTIVHMLNPHVLVVDVLTFLAHCIAGVGSCQHKGSVLDLDQQASDEGEAEDGWQG